MSSQSDEETTELLNKHKSKIVTDRTDIDSKKFPLAWMIRECRDYRDEADICKHSESRIFQYYVGNRQDCQIWIDDYWECKTFEYMPNPKSYDKLVESEKTRRLDRLRPHYANDLWTERDKPPDNWNSPLPKSIQQEYEKSYLTQRLLLEEQGMAPPPSSDPVIQAPSGDCTIL